MIDNKLRSRVTQSCYAIAILVISACSTTSQHDSSYQSWGAANSLASDLSMVELVSNGERFDGWVVRVIGVAFFARDSSLLFRDADIADLFVSAESLRLGPDGSFQDLGLTQTQLSELSGKYILIEGIYEHVPRRQLQGLEVRYGPNYAGEIHRINRVTVIQD